GALASVAGAFLWWLFECAHARFDYIVKTATDAVLLDRVERRQRSRPGGARRPQENPPRKSRPDALEAQGVIGGKPKPPTRCYLKTGLETANCWHGPLLLMLPFSVHGCPGTTLELEPSDVRATVGHQPADPDSAGRAHQMGAYPYGRTRMIVFPVIRLVGLKAATASSRVDTLPMFVRSRPSRTRRTISLNWVRWDTTTKSTARPPAGPAPARPAGAPSGPSAPINAPAPLPASPPPQPHTTAAPP